jgi:hypothetical protein
MAADHGPVARMEVIVMINMDAIIKTVCTGCRKSSECREKGRVPNYEIDNYTVISPNENKEDIVPIVRAAWCYDKEE